TREMAAWVRYSPGTQGTEAVVKVDVDLCDANGDVCVEIQGLSSTVLKGDQGIPLHPQEPIQPGLHSFIPVWNPTRPEAHRTTILPETTRILLLGADQDHLAWVQQSFSNAYLLPLPPTATIDVVQALLEGCAFDHLLWIAPDVTSRDARSEK